MSDRFYSYDPEEGFDEHATAEAAEAAAEAVLDAYAGAAQTDLEWSGDVETIHWGRLLPLGFVAGTEGTDGDGDGEPWTNYHLATQPDELAQLRKRVAALDILHDAVVKVVQAHADCEVEATKPEESRSSAPLVRFVYAFEMVRFILSTPVLAAQDGRQANQPDELAQLRAQVEQLTTERDALRAQRRVK